MIRIIKQGELNKDIKKLTCKYCKAEFEADSEDFEVVFTPYNDINISGDIESKWAYKAYQLMLLITYFVMIYNP